MVCSYETGTVQLDHRDVGQRGDEAIHGRTFLLWGIVNHRNEVTVAFKCALRQWSFECAHFLREMRRVAPRRVAAPFAVVKSNCRAVFSLSIGLFSQP